MEIQHYLVNRIIFKKNYFYYIGYDFINFFVTLSNSLLDLMMKVFLKVKALTFMVFTFATLKNIKPLRVNRNHFYKCVLQIQMWCFRDYLQNVDAKVKVIFIYD